MVPRGCEGGVGARPRAKRRGLAILSAALLALTASRAGAQSDSFQSHPGPAPAAPAPKPRPLPRQPVEQDPAMTAPPAAPASVAPAVPPLPSAGEVWARARQAAVAQGIDVPLASNQPFDAATPPQFRALLGAWGPGVWPGAVAGDKVILIILGAGGEGGVRGVVGHNAGMGWANFAVPLAGNGFTVHVQMTYTASGRVGESRTIDDDYWQFELRSDGRLYGSRKAGASVVVLSRLQ